MIFQINNINYCFIHAPKTGGTYIENYILRHIYGNKNINSNNWRQKMKCHLYNDSEGNNLYHMPYQYGGIKNIESYKFFSIIRNPVELRISAYNWLVKKRKYTKSIQKYINEDYLVLPSDNKTRCSSFGLSQNEYVKGSNAKLFLYEDFDKVLDYIDKIFNKSIHRFGKVNVSEITISKVNTSIQKKIEFIFKEDYLLIEQIKSLKK